MAKARNVLKVNNDAELLSYIINETPELKAKIDLPRQGQSIKPIGKLIIDNERYRNAFLNTVNLIGLTIIKRNGWENPWEIFANQGTLTTGQQIREMVLELANVYDYNKNYDDKTRFLQTEIPEVYQYMHEINFEKFYETTALESKMRMAFNEEGALLDFIVELTANLYKTYSYDKFLMDKYQLQRRLLDGTIPTFEIEDINNKDASDILAEMKTISTDMTFLSPDFNPAGVHMATPYDDQFLILDSRRHAITENKVLANAFFKEDADIKTHLALIDKFFKNDEKRLSMLLEENFVSFTDEEVARLKSIVGVLISRQWFMDYYYTIDNAEDKGQKVTEFLNPTTLDRNIFLHVKAVLSTSPFENCAVFTTEKPSVESVAISPKTAQVTANHGLKLESEVVAKGFANKSVIYTIDENSQKFASINESGYLYVKGKNEDDELVPTGTEIVVTATSIFDSTKTDTATITIYNPESNG